MAPHTRFLTVPHSLLLALAAGLVVTTPLPAPAGYAHTQRVAQATTFARCPADTRTKEEMSCADGDEPNTIGMRLMSDLQRDLPACSKSSRWSRGTAPSCLRSSGRRSPPRSRA